LANAACSIAPAPAIIAVVVTAPVEPIQGTKLLVLGQGFLDIDKPGVPQHHIQGGMPQEQPEVVQVTPSLKVAGGEVVAEAVGTAAAVDASPPLYPSHHYLNRVH